MEQRPSGLVTMDDPETVIHLPPGQTPITSAKRIARLRKQPATVGFVDDQMTALASALVQQYGPLAKALRELMLRQQAVEDFCTGAIESETMQARIQAASVPAEPSEEAPHA